MKRPAFQFYPADWRKDSALQSCGMASRGLWHEMLCIMHECVPYGHLAVNGQAMSSAQLARLVGESERSVRNWLVELKAAGVYSETEDWVIYSRRMVKDERLRETRAEAGRLGGNPVLLNQKDNQIDNHAVNQSPTPSSSSSSSSSDLNPIVGLAPDIATGKANKNGNAVYAKDAESVLEYLNRNAGKAFEFRNPSGGLTANAETIIARLKEGYTPQQLREVVFTKVDQWKGNEDMSEYLRPETLFGRKKFHQYLGEIGGGSHG